MNMFEGKIQGGYFKSDLFEYPLSEKQIRQLKDYEDEFSSHRPPEFCVKV